LSALQRPSFTHEIKEIIRQGQKQEQIETKYDFLSEPDKSLQVLSFLMAGHEYGINIINVLELQSLKHITPLPNVPSYVKGVINLHGVIFPVFDLRERFNLKDCHCDVNTSIIALKILRGGKKKIVGIVVDKVSDTFTISQREIMEAPKNNSSSLAPHILGVVILHDKMVPLLEVDSIFNFE
jgi:purine-binding chemotaxis protein CheW